MTTNRLVIEGSGSGMGQEGRIKKWPKASLGLVHMFIISIMVLVLPVYTYIKIYQIKYMWFIVCQLHLEKIPNFKKIKIPQGCFSHI